MGLWNACHSLKVMPHTNTLNKYINIQWQICERVNVECFPTLQTCLKYSKRGSTLFAVFNILKSKLEIVFLPTKILLTFMIVKWETPSSVDAKLHWMPKRNEGKNAMHFWRLFGHNRFTIKRPLHQVISIIWKMWEKTAWCHIHHSRTFCLIQSWISMSSSTSVNDKNRCQQFSFQVSTFISMRFNVLIDTTFRSWILINKLINIFRLNISTMFVSQRCYAHCE